MNSGIDNESFKLNSDILHLVPFLPSDSELFHTLNVHPFIRIYLWDNKRISMEFVTQMLCNNENCFRNKGFGLWKIILSDSQKIAGYSGLWYFFEEVQPQLVYAILPVFKGRGIATKAARLVIDYSFQELNFEYILASTDEANTDSHKVAKRLGMKLTEKSIKNGKHILFYKLQRQDWRLSI